MTNSDDGSELDGSGIRMLGDDSVFSGFSEGMARACDAYTPPEQRQSEQGIEPRFLASDDVVLTGSPTAS